ncbi:DUF7716 domain-containing protein [Burkholderia diffusa]|uniref:DUF7716 domain-containing protein n=1 Tax=Burkholderia diffusa TaxID=488732 RepID=UPI0008418AE2|nr:hypothetical protein [Burkholderia diffusa]AOI56432.1 hypothetical protein WI26_01865 [Burkholderia diffusa]
MSDFKHKTYQIEDFIAFVQAKQDRSAQYNRAFLYDVYGDDSVEDLLREGQTIFVGDTVQVDDNDEEIYPREVNERGYAFLYSGENFQAVVDLAYKQKPTASAKEVIQCLNYYAQHDDFLDLY